MKGIAFFGSLLIIGTFALGELCQDEVCSFAKTYNSSLPIMNAVATCNYGNPCAYNIPNGWMLQFTMPATSRRFSFTITGSGPFYADFGPDTHHYFSGSCCAFGSNTNASVCTGDFMSQVSYTGSCPTTCPTSIGVWNKNTFSINVKLSVYGEGGPM